MFDSPARVRALATAAALLAATGAIACGSDNDDDTGGQAGAAQVGADRSADPRNAADRNAGRGGNPGAIEQVLKDAQADFIAADGAAYCSKLTAAGKAQVIDYGRQYAKGSTCPEIITTTSEDSKKAGLKQRPTRLVSVEINGTKATAQVSDGGRPAEPLRFVKQGQDWKIPNPGFKVDLTPKTKLKSDPQARVKQLLRLRRDVERRRNP